MTKDDLIIRGYLNQPKTASIKEYNMKAQLKSD